VGVLELIMPRGKRMSAGLLPYRKKQGALEVLLVHPGGPFWKNKDDGAWSIPKGEVEPDEELLAAAQRELSEETGFLAKGPYIALGTARAKSGKWVVAWAFESEADPAALRSNDFEMEWPPRSGKQARFPEVDRAAWFPLTVAQTKINTGQLPLLEALVTHLEGGME
jgi:predicted NUDIX family NTP pyrophosphohydrolase